MTTLIAIFCLALVLSLALTPLVTKAALRFGLVDRPTARKVHTRAIPRVGGIAIALSFFLAFVTALFGWTEISRVVAAEPKLLYILAGAYLAFLTGLWDDIRRLNPWIKLSFQALAAVIAWTGGVRIKAFVFPVLSAWQLDALSLPVTVFWVLLVINAINLIDGLDGLAAGVCFFVTVLLLVLTTINQNFVVAVGFAALAGATLGFLRYNFNPASIFMGDSGSYFLGYLLATFSILGSIKSQAALSLLIPMIALGVPLMDTLWATIRRFLLGRKLFSPDREHFHHQLLQLGLKQRHAVLTLYGVTICLGMLAVALVHLRDDRAALLLVLVGAAAIVGIRRLGYFGSLSRSHLADWMRDLSDETGLSRERRSFLDMQLRVAAACDYETLWQRITTAMQQLEFDMASLYVSQHKVPEAPAQGMPRNPQPADGLPDLRPGWPAFHWKRDGFCDETVGDSRSLLRLELPLTGDRCILGTLLAVKDLEQSDISHYTLKRLEHLRRNILRALCKIALTESYSKPRQT